MTDLDLDGIDPEILERALEHVRERDAEVRSALAPDTEALVRADRARLEREHAEKRALAAAIRAGGGDPRDHCDEPPRRRLTGGTGSR